MKIEKINLYQYSLPFTCPLVFKKRLIQNRLGVIVEIIDEKDQSHFGDICPLPYFSKDTLNKSIREAKTIIKELIGSFWSLDYLFSKDNILSRSSNYSLFPSLYFSLESTIYLALQNISQPSICQPLNYLLTGSRGQVIDMAERLPKPANIKLKIPSWPIEDAITFVKEVIHALGKDAKICLDVNRRWSLVEAIHFSGAFDEKAFTYIEEPLKNPYDLLSFSYLSSHPIGFDESLLDCPWHYLMQIPGKKALILKPQLIGSLRTLIEYIEKAKNYGLLPVLSSLFDSGIGHRNLALLAHVFHMDYPVGIGTYTYLKKDLLLTPINITSGNMQVFSNMTKQDLDFSMLKKLKL